MRILKRVDPVSAMRVGGILYAFFGLLGGALITLLAMLGLFGGPRGANPMPFPFGLFFGGLAIVVLPIFYGVLGGLMAGLFAWLYNVAANFVGGIAVEVSEERAPSR